MRRRKELAGCALRTRIKKIQYRLRGNQFMKKIFFIHFNEEELKEKIKPLKKAGYKVDSHFSDETTANLKNNLPYALVICLDRLPSHGRTYAEWMLEAKKRQQIPIVFCGGKPEKTEPVKINFPKAIFCSNENLLQALGKLNLNTLTRG
jgi:tRNA A37 threonylcarbamoyladenosine dehydratase